MRQIALCALLVLASAVAQAETVYVDDTLRVGVRNKPGNTDPAVEVITSGAALEVLERGEKGYMRVRTASGAEGWVSSVYITTNPPARLLLDQVRQENAALQNQLRDLRGGKAVNPANSAEAVQVMSAELEDLRKENALLTARFSEIAGAEQPSSNLQMWLIDAGVLLALFIAGIVLGKRHERQRVASRFNGLRF